VTPPCHTPGSLRAARRNKTNNIARDTVERGLVDGLIVSSAGPGLVTDLVDVERVRRTCPATSIFLGSGVALDNVRDFLPAAYGFIVASSLKLNERLANPVDTKRAAALARALRI
jgi:uncharacterized protein